MALGNRPNQCSVVLCQYSVSVPRIQYPAQLSDQQNCPMFRESMFRVQPHDPPTREDLVPRSLLSLCIGLACLSPLATAQDRDVSNAGNEKVAEIIRTFAGRGVQSDGSEPTPAEACVGQFQMRDGFEIDLVASEPAVSQPLFLSWDSRGRMWVVQYRQYQFPAGLKIVRYDQHLRAVFDKVPEPPPHGPRGADKITVFTDTDGDGRYDTSKDVITGLNIATSVQVGRGGIWVLNPPYLLFYPDTNGDDVPDRDPEVHLSGFGLQDTHSVANSMLWGPDGWLYGANGSTTVGTVSSAVTKGVHFMGQCVWRYHPTSKVFEIFAEGGGNTFALDMDSKGRVFVGYNGGGTRGFYHPQGSYSQKGWGKHGPLTNPYAFGYFRPMKFEGDSRRFPQALLIYEGGLFPAGFDGSIIAPNAMHNLVWHSRRIPDGSTYRTVDESNLVESPDRWFRPVYAGVGPDGAVYLADWYDTRLSHVSPIDDWHKESGRIYRIYPTDSQPSYTAGDLSRLGSSALIERFDHPNKWVRRRAALELGWRGDKSVVSVLAKRVTENGSLESLWALNLLDELSPQRAVDWLSHDDPEIRRWVVRLLGDRRATLPPSTDAELPPETEQVLDWTAHGELAKLAERETDVQVRSQLAATAKRLDTSVALPIIRQLLNHSEDLSDPHLPLMIWWALEAHAENWDDVEALLAERKVWKLPMFRQEIAGRIMQRYAASGSAEDFERCLWLTELAPDAPSHKLLMVGLNRAFQGRKVPQLPAVLEKALAAYQTSVGESPIVLALRQGKSGSVDEAIEALRHSATELGVRIELANAFGENKHPRAIDVLIKLATGRDTNEAALQRVAIRSLAKYDNDGIPGALIGAFGGPISRENQLRETAFRTLASRPTWAQRLLAEFTEWRLEKREMPADVLQQLRTYDVPEIKHAVAEVFGEPVAISAPEKVARMQHLTDLLTAAAGDASAGKGHFSKHCAICHKLFGEGKTIGPPLDSYDRGSLKFWLPAIVEPSLEIREGYQSYAAHTNDGRTITGMMAARDPNSVTIRTAEDQSIVLDRDDLEDLQAIATSLMPDDTLKELTDNQIRDLFAYLSLGVTR